MRHPNKKSTQAQVWASRAMMDTSLLKGFDGDTYLENKTQALDVLRRTKKGKALPTDTFPREMYVAELEDEIIQVPDFLNAGGVWVVSGRFAAVLRDFELGQTRLHPVRLFQQDRATPIPGEYYCLGFAETKDTFLPSESPRADKAIYSKGIWTLKLDPRDNEIALAPQAVAGVDLWIEPKIRSAFFLSDRLVKALEAQQLTQVLGLTRCRVLETH